MRLHVERVRVEVECSDIYVIEGALRRIVKDLTEALDRTPYTVTSRQLIEGSLKLSMGAYNVALRLLDKCREA